MIHLIGPTLLEFNRLHNSVARMLSLSGSLNNTIRTLTGQLRATIHLFQKVLQLYLGSQWIMVVLEMLVEWMLVVQVIEG